MSNPTPEQWQRIEALFDEALSLQPDERTAYLAEACSDAGLRAHVERLLAADAQAGTFLDTPAHEAVSPLFHDLKNPLQTTDTGSLIGRRLGAYRLVDVLGQGGMGTVHLAERADGQYEHRVALKLVRPGPDSSETYRRFAAERQILARLQHPGIARLLDGGVTEPTPEAPHGQPYFVMDYVAGEPITTYCEAQRLDMQARLRLFLQVCEAVQYAHRNLVVHRDLKPSNILVTDDGQVKLLDFGIAKLLGSDEPGHDPEAMMLTRTGHLLMTPEYAAPEQVRGEAVTTTTDVYALGVLLYEVLTGQRPYQFDQYTPTEIERVICEQEPTKPSTAVRHKTTTANDTPPTIHLDKQLRGDLDTIVMMALRKEPERRYGSVEQLAEDLRRYLGGLPVLAREDTVGYRTRKFFQRHRLGVTAAALVIVALVAGLTVALWQAGVAAAERDRARLESTKAAEVKTYLVDLFEISSPDASKGETISARELLERGAERLETELADQPEVQAEMLYVIGEVYWKLGLFDRSRALAERALALRRSHFGPEHPEIALSLAQLGTLARNQGHLDESEQYHRESLMMRQKLFGKAHVTIANSLNNVGFTLSEKGQLEQADSLYREALAMYDAVLGPGQLESVGAMHNLALVLHDQAQYADAVPFAEEALRIQKEAYGELHSGVANTLHALALITKNNGDPETAETYYRQALNTKEQLLGSDHPSTLLTVNNLALLLSQQGNLKDAEVMYRKALDANRSIYGSRHRRVGLVLNNLGRVQFSQGAIDEADTLFTEALSIFREVLGSDHNYVGAAQVNRGRIFERRREWPQALAAFREAQTIFDNAFSPDHPGRSAHLIGLGNVFRAQGQARRAEPLLREALAIRQKHFADEHRAVAEARAALGLCLFALNAREEAAPLLRASFPILEPALGPIPFVRAIDEALNQLSDF